MQRLRIIAATILLAASGSAGIQPADPSANPQRVAGAQDAQPADEPAATPAPLTGLEALRAATAIFPTEPVSLYGSLILRRQSGVTVREIPFSMSLRWGDSPPSAEYAIMDSFGRTILSARLARLQSGESKLDFFDGDGNPAPAPSPSSQIMGTDITWLDITLAYLWWEDATLLEPAVFRGSLCDVVEVRPPSPMEGCESVRLWIDRKHRFLRQAEQFGPGSERVRWMWVASVGKIGDRWTIRNLEVKRPGTGLQTKLHVDDAE